MTTKCWACLSSRQLGTTLGSMFSGENRFFSVVTSRANMPYLAVRTHKRAAVYLHEVILQLCWSSGLTGYSQKHRSYHKTSNAAKSLCLTCNQRRRASLCPARLVGKRSSRGRPCTFSPESPIIRVLLGEPPGLLRNCPLYSAGQCHVCQDILKS